MATNKVTRIAGGLIGAGAVTVLFLKALADAASYAGFLFDILPEPIRRFVASPNGTLVLLLAGFGLLFWAIKQPANDQTLPSHELAFQQLREENDRLQRKIAALEQQQPRSLSSDQSRMISERAKRWPAFTAAKHRRQVLVAATPKAHDAKGYANQIRLAFSNGDIYSDEVHDLDWGSEVDDRLEFLGENRKFLQLHDANVTVCGTEGREHDGEALESVLLDALRLAGIDVVARPDIRNFGQVSVVVGRGVATSSAGTKAM